MNFGLTASSKQALIYRPASEPLTNQLRLIVQSKFRKAPSDDKSTPNSARRHLEQAKGYRGHANDKLEYLKFPSDLNPFLMNFTYFLKHYRPELQNSRKTITKCILFPGVIGDNCCLLSFLIQGKQNNTLLSALFRPIFIIIMV